MTVYRFRVTFEEYSDVSRDIEVKAAQTFEHLVQGINESIGFDSKNPSSLFFSDEHWKRGIEYCSDANVKKSADRQPMKGAKLVNHINDPHQKLSYVIYSEPGWEFFVELFKIQKEEDSAKYPRCVKTIGLAPKQYGATTLGKVKTDLDLPEEEVFVEDEYTNDGEESAEPEPATDSIVMAEEPSVEELAVEDDMSIDEEMPGDPDAE